MPNYLDAIDEWRERGREVLTEDPLNVYYPHLFRRRLYAKSGQPDSLEFDRMAQDVFEWLLEHERDYFIALIPRPKKKPIFRVATPAEVVAAVVEGVLTRLAKPFQGTVQKSTPMQKPAPISASASPGATDVDVTKATASDVTATAEKGASSVILPKPQRLAMHQEEHIFVKVLAIITGILSLALWLTMIVGNATTIYEPLALYIVPAFGILTMVATFLFRRTG